MSLSMVSFKLWSSRKIRPAILLVILLSLSIVLYSFQENQEPQGTALAAPTISRIIVIGWDGVQRDHFWQCYNKDLPECSDGLPHIKKLAKGKIFDSTVTSGDTCTKPGWAQILSGYDAGVMGIYDNADYQPLPEGYSVFEKLEKRFGEKNIITLFVAGKGPQLETKCPGELGEKKGQPWCLTKKHLDYYENNVGKNENVGNKALELLEWYKQKHSNKKLFAFFHFRDPDNTGHKFGENSVEYSKKIRDDDYWLGKIVTKLKKLEIYDQTLIYVITDHGFDEGEHSHVNAPYGFLATNDPQVSRSGDRKDLAPTILKRFGLSLGADGNIPAVNGYPLDSIPPISCIPEGEAYVDYPNAPQCCSGLSLIGLEKYSSKKGRCVSATGGGGDNSGYCTKYGDGECKKPENKCNCLEDCAAPKPTPTPSTGIICIRKICQENECVTNKITAPPGVVPLCPPDECSTNIDCTHLMPPPSQIFLDRERHFR